MTGYIGTYDSENSKGIYRIIFDENNGKISEPELFYELQNAKWVSLYGDMLIAPMEQNGCAGICLLKIRSGEVESAFEILEERQTPCYILQDGSDIYTANYHEGTVMAYHIEAEKNPEVAGRIENGHKAGCHQILLHESYIMVPCLEQHRICLFDRKRGLAEAGEIPFPQGSGPRHGVFNQSHTRFYVVSEWSNELFVFQVQDVTFKLIQKISVLPENCSGETAAAAIRLTREERFLYISLRGQELLAVLDVSGDKAVMLQHVSCGGSHPRDFILSRDEQYVIVANRFSGGVVSMKRDRKSGLIGEICSQAEMAQAVSIAFGEI